VCSIPPSIRPTTAIDPNLRAESLEGEIYDDIDPFLKSRHDFNDEFTKLHTTKDNHPPPSIIDMEDIIGRSFIMDKQDDDQHFRSRIVKLIEDHEARVENNKDRFKVLSLNDDRHEEVITYNQLLEYLAKDSEIETLWKFKRITSHQGPLLPSHPDYNGPSYNLLI
jgi:hypothetical protein